MDEIEILAESIVKLEEVKEELCVSLEDPDWNSSEQDEPITLKIGVKKEDEEEELEPVASVFLEPKETMKEEVKECEDPLALCRKDLSVTSGETEGSSWSQGGECTRVGPSSESRKPAGTATKQSLDPICQRSSTGREGFVRRTPTHKYDSLFRCSVCQKSFTERRHLDVHMLIHTVRRPFECFVCLKSFTTKGILVGHMRIHTGERLFECSVCKMSFTQRGLLVEHMRIHTGERPFECFVCQKSFTRRRTLVRHMRIHTGKRPFACSVCQKRFMNKGDLVNHNRTHTGQRPFECSVCQKSFTLSGNLGRHMRIHTGGTTRSAETDC